VTVISVSEDTLAVTVFFRRPGMCQMLETFPEFKFPADGPGPTELETIMMT
jgi:hypothetical protein